MTLQPFETGNSRLIYSELSSQERNFIPVVGQLDALVLAHPRLTFAHEYFCAYFFAPSEDPEFSKLPWWFGREVIGFASENELNGLKSVDLDAGAGFETELPSKIVSLEQIFREEAEWRQKTSHEMAMTWRILIPSAKGEVFNGPSYLQFFKS